jgi:tripartite-type tricarboxylate transporter receptor subunit TctC
MKTLYLTIAALAVAASTGLPGRAFSQEYPNKPIRFLMPHPVGAGMDFVSRTIGNKMTASWGQQVIVDSRGGAGGVIGLQMAAKAPADGYTLVPTSIGPLAVNPSLHRNLPYDTLRDFDPITTLISALNILVVNPAVPANSVKELIALAKAKPGQLKYASSANGNTDHLAGELLKAMAGIDMVHVPYKGGAPASIAILNGEVDAIFAVYQNIAPMVKAGKLRVLAVAVADRWPTLPDVPTVAEMGVPGFQVINWYGMVAPAGTPKQIIAKVNKEVARILHMPDVVDLLAQNGMVPLLSTPEQFGSFLQSEIKKWAKVVKDANIRVD